MINRLYSLLLVLGGPGLLIMGVLDSSFLVLPFGNDLLLVALTARKHVLLPYYALMATAGSMMGCVVLDVVFRKGGEEGLERAVPRRRLRYVKQRMAQRAGWALALASVAPPPFPFTIFVAAASGLQYPRKKLLAFVGAGRLVRFSIEGVLAITFGRSILGLAQSPVLKSIVVGLIVVSIVASTVSLLGWFRQQRGVAGAG